MQEVACLPPKHLSEFAPAVPLPWGTADSLEQRGAQGPRQQPRLVTLRHSAPCSLTAERGEQTLHDRFVASNAREVSEGVQQDPLRSSTTYTGKQSLRAGHHAALSSSFPLLLTFKKIDYLFQKVLKSPERQCALSIEAHGLEMVL